MSRMEQIGAGPSAAGGAAPGGGPDPATLRGVLGRFATGVTIVTTLAPSGEVAGVTASSFNTLSLDPPLILWSLGLRARSLPVFRAAERFAVSILGADQAEVARAFARPAADKFAGIGTFPGLGGLPLIAGAIAHLECRVHRRDPGGDHELYIGLVERAAALDRAPLVYHRGGFARLGGAL